MFNTPDNEHTFKDEPEAAECEKCFSAMTEILHNGYTWLACDECGHLVELGNEYAEEAMLDHLTSEQFPNV